MTNRVIRNVDCDEVYTFQDAVDRLGIATQVRCAVRDQNILRIAVSNAYRDLPHKHDWKYYKRTYQFATEGQVVFTDFTYNATTRIGTSASTWPVNAVEGMVVINSNLYTIEERIDDNNVRFQATNAPSNVTTAVTWVRNSYPIPCIRRVASVIETPTLLEIVEQPQETVAEYLRLTPLPSQPIMYNIHGLGVHLSRMHIEFAPPPLSSMTYIISGDMRPRDILVHKDEFFVSVTGVTATPDDNRKFLPRHVGSILRFSKDGKAPTGLFGSDGEYNPYVSQRVIVAVNASGVATLDEAPGDMAGVAAVASDPLDIDTETMLGYFDALAARKLAEMTVSPQGVADMVAIEKEALRSAIGADQRTKSRKTRTWGGHYDFRGVLDFPIAGRVVQ